MSDVGADIPASDFCGDVAAKSTIQPNDLALVRVESLRGSVIDVVNGVHGSWLREVRFCYKLKNEVRNIVGMGR
jgi:hypothetical protein